MRAVSVAEGLDARPEPNEKTHTHEQEHPPHDAFILIVLAGALELPQQPGEREGQPPPPPLGSAAVPR